MVYFQTPLVGCYQKPVNKLCTPKSFIYLGYITSGLVTQCHVCTPKTFESMQCIMLKITQCILN